jgi:hypothetical protein
VKLRSNFSNKVFKEQKAGENLITRISYFLLFTKHYEGNKIKENDTDGTLSMHENVSNAYKSLATANGRRLLGQYIHK